MRLLCCLVALAAILVSPIGAWADEAEDLLDKLDGSVSDLARAIGAMDEGDTGDIGDVRDDLGDIGDILGDLVAFEDSVDDLDRLISDYRDDLERSGDALDALTSMANLAGQIDPLIDECEEIEREFTRFMQLVVQDEDADLDDVEKHAGDVGGTVEAFVDDAEETIEDMVRFHREAARPGLRHSDFRAVDRALVQAADALLEQEQDSAEALLETCALLVDYQDHPGYEAAVAFFVDIDAAIETFIDDAESWLERHENIGPELCILMTDIRDAYCSLDMEASEEDPRFDGYEDAVLSTQNAFLRAIDDALTDYERNLAGIGDNLSQYDSRADALYERLRARAAYYYRLQRSDELRNMNNVAHRLWIIYGQQQHERMQTASYCHVVEKYPPGYSGRVDCVDIARCTVWEIKSDSHDRSSGMSQANGYASAINTWMAGQWDDDDPVAPATGSLRRGMAFDEDFLAQAVANECLVNGVGKFDGDLLTYPRCREDIDLLCEPQPD